MLICSKFTGELPRLSVISKSNFIEIIIWNGCSPVNVLHIFRTNFYKSIYEGLLLKLQIYEKLVKN